VASSLFLALHAEAGVVSRVAIHPDANDVTAAATASSRSRVVAALGTAAVPQRVHFLVSDAPNDASADMGVARWTHDGAFALPAGAGAVRSAAVSSGARHPTETYFALGTDQSPGVVVPAGALVGDPVVLEQGEDVLAAAVASEVSSFSPNADASANATETAAAPCFVFATWTSPSRLVRVEVDENTRTLRRAAGKTLPLGVNRVRAAVADPRRFQKTDGSTPRRVAHFVSDTSPSALVTVRVDDLAIVDALVFPLAMNGSRVRRGAIIEDTSTGSGASISYWVTKPAADGAKIGSTLFRVAHGSADIAGGAVITGAYAFETHERDVAAVSVERTKKLGESAFGSDEATVAYVAFDAVAGNDGDVEGTKTDALHSCAVVALAERRDKRTGAFSGFERIATVLIPNARALTPVRVADGVATYATRGSPAELVEVDFFSKGLTETNENKRGAVFANSGPDVPSHTFQDSEILCVAFLNATHFGATVLFAGGRVGAGGRRLLSAALAARGAAVGETWKARAC
jgi:hypothetical protein